MKSTIIAALASLSVNAFAAGTVFDCITQGRNGATGVRIVSPQNVLTSATAPFQISGGFQFYHGEAVRIPSANASSVKFHFTGESVEADITMDLALDSGVPGAVKPASSGLIEITSGGAGLSPRYVLYACEGSFIAE
jgi:hypothetical protein